MVGASLIVFDPLSPSELKSYSAILLVLLIAFEIYFEWSTFGKRMSVVFACVLVVAFIGVGAYLYINNFAPIEPGAETVMSELQLVATECMARGEDLRAFGTKFKRDIPRVQSPICSKGENWKRLPSGWAYDPLQDHDVSDGTFAFSARSRNGDFITCTESGCRMMD